MNTWNPRRAIVAWTVAALIALFPSTAAAQTPWETPRLMSPDAPEGIGFYWVSYGTLPQDGPGLLATWHMPGLPAGVSVRGGAAEGANGTTSGFAGVDVSTPLSRHTESQPLDLAWTTGAGVGLGDYLLFTVPIGISAGRSWSSGSVWLAPYVAAGAAMDLRLGSESPEEDFELSPTLDVGLDLSLDQGRRLVFRAGTSLGDRGAVAVGLAYRPGGN